MKCLIWIVLTLDADGRQWVEAYIDEIDAGKYLAFYLSHVKGSTGTIKSISWENIP